VERIAARETSRTYAAPDRHGGRSTIRLAAFSSPSPDHRDYFSALNPMQP
jgi:hypothetical protein